MQTSREECRGGRILLLGCVAAGGLYWAFFQTDVVEDPKPPIALCADAERSRVQMALVQDARYRVAPRQQCAAPSRA
jgi:hypothetical protein